MINRINPEEHALQEERRVAKELHAELAPRGLTYHIESYGCQMNAHDSEKLAGMLVEMGFAPAADKANADFILFNTCCVREHAEKRVFGNVGALKKRKDENPGLLIGVCGCMMQQKEVAKRLYKRYPFVNLIFGTHSLHELPGLMRQALNGERPFSIHEIDGDVVEGLPILRAPGVSASVTIMYGCNNYCSYCIVPYVRGRERSRQPEEIIAEIESLAKEGYSEITLLGQNVNSYGQDLCGCSFAQLLAKASEVEGIRRIRFMTSHPKDLSDELITAMATLPKVCRHIHLPVQSGSDRILKLMNRRYTSGDYQTLISKLREKVPGVELTTDIIVGFPGETQEDFQQTLRLIDQVGFAAAFTFMYSPRGGTKAAEMEDQLTDAEKKARLFRINALQEEKVRENNEKYMGHRGTVLIEGVDERAIPMAYGKLSNFKMVYFPGSNDMIGAYREIIVENTQKNSLMGRLLL